MSKKGLSCSVAYNVPSVACSIIFNYSAINPSHSAPSRSNPGPNFVWKGSRPFSLVKFNIKKCRRRDSNPQGITHMNLNHARLPIPPLRHSIKSIKLSSYFYVVSVADVLSRRTLSKNDTQSFFCGRVPHRHSIKSIKLSFILTRAKPLLNNTMSKPNVNII